MRSRGSRIALERALRAVAVTSLAAVAWLLLGARRPLPARLDVELPDTAQLARWTASAPADSVRLRLVRAPDALRRDWLAALARAGTALGWTDGGVPSLAFEVAGRADPAGGAWIAAAGLAPELPVVLADSLGVLDTLPAPEGGAAAILAATLTSGATAGAIEISQGPASARAVPAISRLGRAVVLARAGWEARFAITALEERGWSVATRLEVAPGVAVRQGEPERLDTSRVAVVVVLDSLQAQDRSGVVRFVRQGGGLVLGPGAGDWVGLAPASLGPRVAARTLAFASAAPRRALGLRQLIVRPGASVLETEDGAVTVAAGRAGAGRVVQFGYEDTWRWRMQGGSDAVAEHRQWWASLLAAAAYRPEPGAPSVPADPAPRAALAAALGPPLPASGDAARQPADPLRFLPWAAAALFAALLGEWGSRRIGSRQQGAGTREN
ncbi:MAG TPA: hypothetical protein VNL98_11030 [Gemmatimonadales bacterium]|nr:hypothetical protein [Gemmatimonadales bacterium]